jgi:hypothetical protein
MTQQSDASKLKKVLVHIFRIFIWVFCWLVSCAVILWVMLDYNTPGDLISWRLAFPIVVCSVLVLVLILIQKRSDRNKGKVDKPQLKRYSSRPSKRKLFWLIGLFCAVVLAVVIGYWQFTEAENRDLLRTAAEHFVIDSRPDVSQGQEDSTAIELERAYRHLSDIVPEFSVEQPIVVHVYPNVTEMQRLTGRSGNTAGFTGCSPNGPIMFLPAERDTDDSRTSTPGHEMVHAIMCEMLGTESTDDIPKWFNEGLAEYESKLGWERMMERNKIRIFVVSNREDIMQYTALDLYNPVLSDDYDEIFYRSSFEFMRYIISESSRLAPWEIINAVKEGQTFALAFQNAVGDSPSSMYQKWVDNFYGILD